MNICESQVIITIFNPAFIASVHLWQKAVFLCSCCNKVSLKNVDCKQISWCGIWRGVAEQNSRYRWQSSTNSTNFSRVNAQHGNFLYERYNVTVINGISDGDFATCPSTNSFNKTQMVRSHKVIKFYYGRKDYVTKISLLKRFCETLREDNEAWKPPPVRYPGMVNT